METISFTQDELKLLLAFLNLSVKSGALQLGDVLTLAPLVNKIDAKIKKEELKEAPKEEVKN